LYLQKKFAQTGLFKGRYFTRHNFKNLSLPWLCIEGYICTTLAGEINSKFKNQKISKNEKNSYLSINASCGLPVSKRKFT
jgi:hypothetical protein